MTELLAVPRTTGKRVSDDRAGFLDQSSPPGVPPSASGKIGCAHRQFVTLHGARVGQQIADEPFHAREPLVERSLA